MSLKWVSNESQMCLKWVSELNGTNSEETEKKWRNGKKVKKRRNVNDIKANTRTTKLFAFVVKKWGPNYTKLFFEKVSAEESLEVFKMDWYQLLLFHSAVCLQKICKEEIMQALPIPTKCIYWYTYPKTYRSVSIGIKCFKHMVSIKGSIWKNNE